MGTEAKLRIVHAVRQYLPGVGGMENFVALLAAEQRRAGHQVRVITLNRIFDGDGVRLPGIEIIDGITVHRVRFVGSRRYALAPAALRWAHDADVIHVHGLEFFAEAFATLSLWRRATLVLSTHGGIFHTNFLAPLKRLWFATVTPATLKRYRAVIACSLQDAETFGKVAGSKVVTIENGVDIVKFAGLAAPVAAGGVQTMIYFGRLAPNKQVHRLIAWFATLHGRHPEWRLIIAGKPMGVAVAELREFSEKLGVGHAVAIHAAPDDTELRTLIAQSSVYACASEYEGFGLAAVEAASAGLFPLLSDIPAFRRTLDRLDVGIAIDFDPGHDIDIFVDAFQSFKTDSSRAEQLAKRLDTFAWHCAAEQIERVYRAAMTGRRGGAPSIKAHEQHLAAVR